MIKTGKTTLYLIYILIVMFIFWGAVLFSKKQNSLSFVYAQEEYSEEEKQQAKAWLVAHGYPPTRAGAQQAYQDYLDGKFDDEFDDDFEEYDCDEDEDNKEKKDNNSANNPSSETSEDTDVVFSDNSRDDSHKQVDSDYSSKTDANIATITDSLKINKNDISENVNAVEKDSIDMDIIKNYEENELLEDSELTDSRSVDFWDIMIILLCIVFIVVSIVVFRVSRKNR